MKKIVVASVLSLLVSNYMMPAQANPIAPECKDIPSCGVAGIIIGTEIVGGVLYYVVQSGASAIHKVRAKRQIIPAHRTTEPGRHNVGDKVTLTKKPVNRPEECEKLAREYGRNTDGGEWVVDSYDTLGTPGAPGIIDPNGRIIEETIQYICKIRKVR